MSFISHIFQGRLFSQVLIILLISLFLIISLSIPGLQINDEWISANQLHQVIQGHQVLTSEGKYGSLMGEISPYFKIRSNILGYSLMLPLIASGPMLFFMVLGDFFRLGIIFFWALIPVIIAVLLEAFLPEYSRIKRIPVLIPAMGLSLLLLFINLPFYYPFPSSILEYPLESAALVLTANILFSTLCVVLYLIGGEIFKNKKKGVFVAISLIACSSFIYWGTSGKDHILSIMLFAICLYFLIKYLNDNTRYYASLGFFFLGLTTWVRPELGLTLFFMLGLYFLVLSLFPGLIRANIHEYLYRIRPIFAFFLGLIPFVLNNYLITGNPILSPFIHYMPDAIPRTTAEVVNSGILPNITGVMEPISSEFGIQELLILFLKQYSLNTPTLLNDLKGIFFFPDNGSMPVAALTPFLFIGLTLIPTIILRRKQVSERDSRILYLCICAVIGIFIAYMRSIHGLHTSEGIAPDIRYLAPLYIPGGIIGIIAMKYWKYCPITTEIWKTGILFIIIGTPILLIGMLLIQPFGGGFFYYTYTLSLCSFGLLFLLVIQYLLMETLGKWNPCAIRGNILLLLVVSISWQLMMVALFSMAKFDGYSFWIPMSELVVSNFIVPVT